MRNQTETDISPLEFCDPCFQKEKPNLCEIYKNTFTKINSIHFSQQARLTRLLNKLEVAPRIVERRWTCIMSTHTRKEFLDSIWETGVSVHTLNDHVKVLTRLYTSEVRRLGEHSQVELPNMDSWEEFAPKTRTWTQINAKRKDGKIIARVNLGNILRCTGVDGMIYYRANKNGNSTALVEIEKRAAYNMMCIIAEPTKIHWNLDTSGKLVLIELKELQNIPEEISSFLKRLSKKDAKLPGMIVFEDDDIELVRTALSCIKINLEKSLEPASISSNPKSEMPMMIKQLTKERLQTLLDIIKAMGGIVEIEESCLVISGKRGSIKLIFVDEDKSTQDGNVIQVSVSALEDPSRFSEILLMIKKKLALMDISFESVISQYWPIATDSDLQYVVQSAVSWYGSNPILAAKIISEGNKLTKIKEWHTKIKEGRIRSNLDTITLGKIIKRIESN